MSSYWLRNKWFQWNHWFSGIMLSALTNYRYPFKTFPYSIYIGIFLFSHGSLQICPFIAMNWEVKELSFRILPPGHTKTIITVGQTYPVFVLAAAKCQCVLTTSWLRKTINYPQPDVDVKVYSDSEPDTHHPEGTSLRKRWYEKHFAKEPSTNKAKVCILSCTFKNLHLQLKFHVIKILLKLQLFRYY